MTLSETSKLRARIACKKRDGGHTRYGSSISLTDARSWVEVLNRAYPELLYWVVNDPNPPVSPPHCNIPQDKQSPQQIRHNKLNDIKDAVAAARASRQTAQQEQWSAEIEERRVEEMLLSLQVAVQCHKEINRV